MKQLKNIINMLKKDKAHANRYLNELSCDLTYLQIASQYTDMYLINALNGLTLTSNEIDDFINSLNRDIEDYKRYDKDLISNDIYMRG